MPWVVTGLLAVSLAWGGCKDQPLTGPDGKPRLTSDEELAKLEQGILGRVEQNRKRICVRPVLRGKAREGTAGEDIIAVVEGAQDTRACLDGLAKHSERLYEVMGRPEGQHLEGWPVRHGRELPALTDDQAILALGQVCAPLIFRLRRAVAHGDACSPFLPGLRGQPAYISLIRSSRYLAYDAWGLLSQGKTRQAAELLLDGLRFCQDASRGPTSLIETMVAVAAMAEPMDVLEALLNQPSPLGDELLARIERELGLLVDNAAHPAVYLTGEMDSMALYALLPGVKDKGWAPPGGWGKEGLPPDLDAAAMELDGLSPVDGAVLAWIGMQEMWAEVLAGCKASDPPLVCHERLHALAEAGAQVPTDDWSVMDSMLDAALSADKRAALRRRIIDILKAVAAPGFDRYVARQGTTLFMLQALRLHAAARRLAEQTGACPAPEAFDAAPLKDLRIDPYSGKPIRVERVGPGRLALWPPVPLDTQAGIAALPGVFVICPKAGK